MDLRVLDEATWRGRAASHAALVDGFVEPHLTRRREGIKHPVLDFLFTYYSQGPAQLRRWHPGFGVALEGGETARGYRVVCPSTTDGAASVTRPSLVTVSEEYVASQRPVIESIRALLNATARRPANLGCFGLHEWAMVHREDRPRHDWPLRLGREGTEQVVESHRIACSHFDAYRFFTPSARTLNVLSPAADNRSEFEQPGCLHAGMDLYKHAFRLTPMISSDLVAECFFHAVRLRELDMRASPYDLSDLGYAPVPIETAHGKQQYIAAQRRLAETSSGLRRRLLEQCDRLATEPVD